MAVAAASVVEIWSNIILNRLMAEYPIRSYVVDRSAELQGRRSMQLTDLKRAITLNTRSDNNAAFGTVGDIDAATVTLTKDKDYDFNEGIGWLDDMETVGQAIDYAQMWALNKVNDQIEEDIIAKLSAATPAVTIKDFAFKTDGTTTDGAAKLTSDEGVSEILDWLLFSVADQKAKGQRQFVFLTAPKIEASISRYLRDKGQDFPSGLAASAFQGGMLPMVHGVTVVPLVNISGSSTAAGTDQFKSYLVDPTQTVHWAQQLYRTRTIADPTAPRDLYQGLLAHGALVPELDSSKAETLLQAQFDFTT